MRSASVSFMFLQVSTSYTCNSIHLERKITKYVLTLCHYGFLPEQLSPLLSLCQKVKRSQPIMATIQSPSTLRRITLAERKVLYDGPLAVMVVSLKSRQR